uniref:ZP domain-containing protein n=1 Tax=Romanomermis culicivorax TaxID=13658 RepID=A0A915ISQ7_ROMCU
MEEVNHAHPPDDSPRIDPKITCSLDDGIIGRMTFDRPFNGKIYSSRYANVAQCIYFNEDRRDFVSFNIPVYSCGSIVEKDEQNRFLHLENEIYVQFDHQTQTIDDRRFLFVCDRRKKISTTIHDDHIRDSNIIKDTLHPGQTVVVDCFATDGGGSIRINLTDSAGCTLRPSVSLGAMTRVKNVKGIISYMLPFKAFKFPASTDVYFSCSVDICSSCNFPEPCIQNPSRKARHSIDNLQKQQQVYDSLRIYNPDDYSFVEDYLLSSAQKKNFSALDAWSTCKEEGFLTYFYLCIFLFFVIFSLIIGAVLMFILYRRKK